MNVCGTIEVLNLCKKMIKLKALIYVSTAFANSHLNQSGELYHPVKVDPYGLILTMKDQDEDTFNTVTYSTVIGSHPNTYTFTKNLSEQVVKDQSIKFTIPSAIVRPSIIIAPSDKKLEFYVDCISQGSTSLIANYALGLNRVLPGKENNIMSVIPVDKVANSVLVAAWKVATDHMDSKTGPVKISCGQAKTNCGQSEQTKSGFGQDGQESNSDGQSCGQVLKSSYGQNGQAEINCGQNGQAEINCGQNGQAEINCGQNGQVSKSYDPEIYGLYSDTFYRYPLGELNKSVAAAAQKYPSMRTVRPPSQVILTSRDGFRNKMYNFFFNTLFARLFDIFFMVTGQKIRLTKLMNKSIESFDTLRFFMSHDWINHGHKFLDVVSDLSEEERKIYCCEDEEMSREAQEDFLMNYWLGIRKWALKETITNVNTARARLQKLSLIYNSFSTFLLSSIALLFATIVKNLLINYN